MSIFANASSFATRKNAVRKLRKVLGDDLDNIHWAVIAQEDGRFSPVVRLGSNSDWLPAALCQAGICVIG